MGAAPLTTLPNGSNSSNSSSSIHIGPSGANAGAPGYGYGHNYGHGGGHGGAGHGGGHGPIPGYGPPQAVNGSGYFGAVHGHGPPVHGPDSITDASDGLPYFSRLVTSASYSTTLLFNWVMYTMFVC
jgi:hypothetical protein